MSPRSKARDAAAEIERLREEIRHHEYLYYVQDDPEISDAAFDRLIEPPQGARSRASRADHARLAHAARRRAPREGLQTVRHKTPMISLDNTYSFEQLGEFDRRVRELTGRDKVDYVAEHKFDGAEPLADLREGKARSRRHARRRHHRRRRHAQREDDPLDSAEHRRCRC